jgi:hypothetical protein
MKHSADLNQ